MKKLFIAMAVLVTALALRRFGPTLAERCMAKCREILDRRPRTSHPNG